MENYLSMNSAQLWARNWLPPQMALGGMQRNRNGKNLFRAQISLDHEMSNNKRCSLHLLGDYCALLLASFLSSILIPQADWSSAAFPIRSCWTSNLVQFRTESPSEIDDFEIVRANVSAFFETKPTQSLLESEHPKIGESVKFLIDCRNFSKGADYLAILHRHTWRAPRIQCHRMWSVDSEGRVALRIGDIRVSRDYFLNHFRRISKSCTHWGSPALLMWHP